MTSADLLARLNTLAAAERAAADAPGQSIRATYAATYETMAATLARMAERGSDLTVFTQALGRHLG